MKKSKSTLLMAALTHAAPIQANAATIFTDTFASGTGSWYSGGNSGASVNATTGILANSSGPLSWTPSTTGDITRAIGRPFTSQTVAVGQTIRITFDSAAAFPAGSFKLANLGSLAIKIELGADTHQCEAGETKVLARVSFGENQSVGMRAYGKRGDQWKLITSGIWSNPGTKRVLQVFIEDLLTKAVTLKGIRGIANP